MTQTEITQTLPGVFALTETTPTQTLIESLRTQRQLPLEFWLNGQALVGPGYHVTEVKAVSIEAMDCVGKAATWRETVIQLMDGSADDAAGGFMSNRKFLAIYDRVTSKIPVRGEAEVRFEYGSAARPAMQYHVTGMESRLERIVVHLRTPSVQCKAGDACGLPTGEVTATGNGCAPDSGCCTLAPVELITLS